MSTYRRTEEGLLVPQGDKTREVWTDGRLIARTLKFCLDRQVQMALACPKCKTIFEPQPPTAAGETVLECQCRRVEWRS